MKKINCVWMLAFAGMLFHAQALEMDSNGCIQADSLQSLRMK